MCVLFFCWCTSAASKQTALTTYFLYAILTMETVPRSVSDVLRGLVHLSAWQGFRLYTPSRRGIAGLLSSLEFGVFKSIGNSPAI